MNQQHDVQREITGLSACLAQAKRPLGFLMGAGCALSVRIQADDGEDKPLIPDIAGLTQQVATKCTAGTLAEAYNSLFTTLEGHLDRPPTVEDFLTRLRTLKDIIGDESFLGLNLMDVVALEKEIITEITTAVDVDLPTGPTPYSGLAIWVGAADRQIAPEVFTTNYDLLLEQALERHHLPYFDGFVGGEAPFLDLRAIEEDEIPARWTRLWKLHGAINWALTPEAEVVRRRDTSNDGNSLIHPSHLKYEQSRRMPYLVMQDRLRAFLRRPGSALFISGYSFGDDHINTLLVDGLRSNRTAAAFALQYANLDAQPHAARLAAALPNLTVLAPDGAVINSVKGGWKATGDATQSMTLGDFASFGTLLRQLVGASRDGAPEESLHAE